MLMSMSVGPYCDLNQDVDSKDYKHGAVVSLVMDENERECNYVFWIFFMIQSYLNLKAIQFS